MLTYKSAWSYFKVILWYLNFIQIKFSDCYEGKKKTKQKIFYVLIRAFRSMCFNINENLELVILVIDSHKGLLLNLQHEFR